MLIGTTQIWTRRGANWWEGGNGMGYVGQSPMQGILSPLPLSGPPARLPFSAYHHTHPESQYQLLSFGLHCWVHIDRWLHVQTIFSLDIPDIQAFKALTLPFNG
jgi:hypothetical protein